MNKVLHVIQLRGRKTQPQYYDIKEILNRNLSYSEFDITLLYFALRNLCNFQPHSNCWGKDPNPIDRTVSANIERLRLLKNTHKSHTPKFHISDFDYGKARIEILKSVSDLEMYLENKTDYQNEIKRLENISMDFEQEVNLQEEANNIKVKNTNEKKIKHHKIDMCCNQERYNGYRYIIIICIHLDND